MFVYEPTFITLVLVPLSEQSRLQTHFFLIVIRSFINSPPCSIHLHLRPVDDHGCFDFRKNRSLCL
jgi:hypothetical protein